MKRKKLNKKYKSIGKAPMFEKKIVRALDIILSTEHGKELVAQWAQPTIIDFQNKAELSMKDVLLEICHICHYQTIDNEEKVQESKNKLRALIDDIYGYSPTQFGGSKMHALAIKRCLQNINFNSIEGILSCISKNITEVSKEEMNTLCSKCYDLLPTLQTVISAVDCQTLDKFVDEI